MERRIINPGTWQDNLGFVQANEVTGAKRMLFAAGQVSVDDNGNLLHPRDMEKQMNQIIDNMEILFEKSDMKFSDVVRLTYYTTDINAFVAANAAMLARLGKLGCKPASSLIGVNALFHPDCVVEIEATAMV